MRAFVHNVLPGRVVFGEGSATQLAEEITRLGLSRILVLSTPGQRAMAEQMSKHLGDLAVGIFDQAVMHIPKGIADQAVTFSQSVNADGCVAIGGGSTIGLAKAIALESGLPIVAIPTTYSGSEMTPIWGLTENGIKTTGRDNRTLPRTAIYDPTLSVSLPAGLSATSGINAIAHCVEALYAQEFSPVISMQAEEGIRALAQSLPVLMSNPRDMAARSDALYGAWLAGSVLGAVGMALHHKLCHTLGGSFNLPHSEVHTVMIAYVTAYNRDAAPEAMAAIRRALGTADAAVGLFDLIAKLGAPGSLKSIGMPEADLDKAAEIATRNPYYNPREVTTAAIRKLLQEAYEGRQPK